MSSKDVITYGMFGIDPASYYATKFANGRIDVAALNDVLTPAQYRFSFLRDEFNSLCPPMDRKLRVLDIGCGSGRVGGYLKAKRPDVELTGMELSAACEADCRYHGYDQFALAGDLQSIPFDDGQFDCVISMDFFGHVEFRNKEPLISETRRVLRRGGAAIHGIETGSVDYFQGDPSDENNPIRKYVWIEGHIGVETPAETIQRFARHFRIERALPMIQPFCEMPEMLDWGTFSDEFRNTFAAFDEPKKNVIANAMTRALYDHCFKRLHHNSRKAITSRVFLRDDSGNETELVHGSFTMISMLNDLGASI